MRGKADPPLRRFEIEACLHDARHEAVGLGPARPAALVQPAEHQRVDGLQPRLERAPDGDAAVAAGAWLDDLRADQCRQHIRPFWQR